MNKQDIIICQQVKYEAIKPTSQKNKTYKEHLNITVVSKQLIE